MRILFFFKPQLSLSVTSYGIALSRSYHSRKQSCSTMNANNNLQILRLFYVLSAVLIPWAARGVCVL